MEYCYHCMAALNGRRSCPVCGKSNADTSFLAYQLPPGTVLKKRYYLGKVLGKGAFGLTYIGMDLRRKIKIAVKEYYPSICCSRSSTVSPWVTMNMALPYYAVEGKAKFLQEAQILTKFQIIRKLSRFFRNRMRFSHLKMNRSRGRELQFISLRQLLRSCALRWRSLHGCSAAARMILRHRSH